MSDNCHCDCHLQVTVTVTIVGQGICNNLIAQKLSISRFSCCVRVAALPYYALPAPHTYPLPTPTCTLPIEPPIEL